MKHFIDESPEYRHFQNVLNSFKPKDLVENKESLSSNESSGPSNLRSDQNYTGFLSRKFAAWILDLHKEGSLINFLSKSISYEKFIEFVQRGIRGKKENGQSAKVSKRSEIKKLFFGNLEDSQEQKIMRDQLLKLFLQFMEPYNFLKCLKSGKNKSLPKTGAFVWKFREFFRTTFSQFPVPKRSNKIKPINQEDIDHYLSLKIEDFKPSNNSLDYLNLSNANLKNSSQENSQGVDIVEELEPLDCIQYSVAEDADHKIPIDQLIFNEYLNKIVIKENIQAEQKEDLHNSDPYRQEMLIESNNFDDCDVENSYCKLKFIESYDDDYNSISYEPIALNSKDIFTLNRKAFDWQAEMSGYSMNAEIETKAFSSYTSYTDLED